MIMSENNHPVEIEIGKNIPDSLLRRTQEYKRNVARNNVRSVDHIISNDEFMNIDSCPICSSSSSRLGEVQGIPYMICAKCGHIFSMIVPSESALDRHYNPEGEVIEFPQDVVSHQRDTYVLDPLSARMRKAGVEEIKANWLKSKFNFENTNPFLVDVGCGSGFFLEAARKIGFSVLGIEMDMQLAQECQKKGIPTLIQKVPGQAWPQELMGAEIITLLNLVEHVIDPVNFISGLATILKPGAWLVIEVPRAESMSTLVNIAIPEGTYRHLTPPEHLHVFSDKSIRLLLKSAELSIIHEWRFGSDAITLLDSILPNEAQDVEAIFSGSFVNKLQKLIDDYGMSDNRIVIARKISTK
jgi:2-polyprenyl-3-methyl-5-hydroxy-6-metoxy-1,4-benzoquinol methylase